MMGESSACLIRSFSHPCDTSREAKEGDPLRALGESISFGRFMSESLAWEKWSSFSHNRYLEEAEKFSKPGSVAQKKAYFEAHYKQIAAKKAAALLEQENSSNDDSPEPNTTHEIHNNASTDSNFELSNNHVAITETHAKEAPKTKLVEVNECNLNVERNESEIPIQVELSNQLENDENHIEIISTLEEEEPKDAANQECLASTSKKKQAISSSRLSTKLLSPAMPMTPDQARKGDYANSNSKKLARDSMEKKRSTPKSLHMSINFSSRVGEASKISSPALQKIGHARSVRTLAKISKDSLTPQRTITRSSVAGESKHPSAIPQPENRRDKTPFNISVSGRGKMDAKSLSVSKDHMEPSSARGSKARSSILYSSFSFRSEERAAKRKEFFQKLEEKVNPKEAEKMQLQAKFKEKAENDFKKMRQSISLKAKPFTNVPRETELASNQLKKIPPTRPRSPKLGRTRTPSPFHDTSSRPPWRSSVKNDGSKHVMEKSNRPPTHSVNLLPKKNRHENASPNIQLSEK